MSTKRFLLAVEYFELQTFEFNIKLVDSLYGESGELLGFKWTEITVEALQFVVIIQFYCTGQSALQPWRAYEQKFHRQAEQRFIREIILVNVILFSHQISKVLIPTQAWRYLVHYDENLQEYSANNLA